jgi:hypothetical protein
MDTVKRAAALLDQARPGWENLIDTERLDLIMSANCVLGQVFGGYSRGLMELSHADPAEYEVVVRGTTKGDFPFAEPPAAGGLKVTRWLIQIMDRRTKVSIHTKERVAA